MMDLRGCIFLLVLLQTALVWEVHGQLFQFNDEGTCYIRKKGDPEKEIHLAACETVETAITTMEELRGKLEELNTQLQENQETITTLQETMEPPAPPIQVDVEWELYDTSAFLIVGMKIDGEAGPVCAPSDALSDPVFQNFARSYCGSYDSAYELDGPPTETPDFWWSIEDCTATSGENLDDYGPCAKKITTCDSGNCGACGVPPGCS